jgi:hypothetical protein
MASTSLNSMLNVFKMWEKMKVFPMLCFTKLFIVTFCPSDQLLCKILCCDFLSYMFCQNAKFNLWLFVLWLFVRDFLSVTFCPVTFCPTFHVTMMSKWLWVLLLMFLCFNYIAAGIFIGLYIGNRSTERKPRTFIAGIFCIPLS